MPSAGMKPQTSPEPARIVFCFFFFERDSNKHSIRITGGRAVCSIFIRIWNSGSGNDITLELTTFQL